MSTTTLAVQDFRYEIMPPDLNITDDAREQLVELLGQIEDDEIEAIRIYVAGGGCGGMTYGMTFTDRRTAYDMALVEDDLRVYVDSVAMQFLKGAEIDYVAKPMGSSFVFNNVFASTGGSGTCGGCGGAQ
jgi:iron-sulfur cluster insertion protein